MSGSRYEDSRYEIVVTKPAAVSIAEKLSAAVAAAVIELSTGPMLDNPRRVGAALRNDLEGLWSARRGTYRVVYRIDEERREVVILRVAHRREAACLRRD
ncbi:MAG: type II toxin-antitoxin system RelE/ParE family toxin [Acidimicrobiaceae bacterium]|nr:type II toxin-antitoxin system RelE/ParE family toxin [Acidimicrobiaceae bacterium]MCY4280979.1 type II toxin-antitoxin system RelE/ParE family toxin [Acidimicrobiaceae bacterium]MCY4295175.1 type II toxin-antitoxin system RelE/ParE family toxin [Acidimicrobiaceae bacterium]